MNSRTLLPILLLGAIAPAARSAVLEVPGQYPTIQAAVDAAGFDDTILIRKGTYPESVWIVGKENLVVRGQGRVTLDAGGAGHGLGVFGCLNVRLEKLRVKNAVDRGFHVFDSSEVVLERCRASSIGDNGFEIEDSDQVVIRSCVVKNGTGYGITMRASDSLITRCRISRVSWNGIRAAGAYNTIDRNSVSRCNIGIRVGIAGQPSLSALVIDNRVTRTTGTAYILANQNDHASLLSNRARNCLGDGITLFGAPARALVSFNRVQKAGICGISAETDQCVFTNNRLTRCGESGFWARPNMEECLISSNTVKGTRQDGFLVEGTDLILSGNRSRKDKGFALTDATPPGTNSYVGNSFPTVQ